MRTKLAAATIFTVLMIMPAVPAVFAGGPEEGPSGPLNDQEFRAADAVIAAWFAVRPEDSPFAIPEDQRGIAKAGAQLDVATSAAAKAALALRAELEATAEAELEFFIRGFAATYAAEIEAFQAKSAAAKIAKNAYDLAAVAFDVALVELGAAKVEFGRSSAEWDAAYAVRNAAHIAKDLARRQLTKAMADLKTADLDLNAILSAIDAERARLNAEIDAIVDALLNDCPCVAPVDP